MPLRGLQETRVATREESGVLGFPSRRGLTPRAETKQRFLEGMLHPCNVLMCPHTCVTNLPKPRQKQPG